MKMRFFGFVLPLVVCFFASAAWAAPTESCWEAVTLAPTPGLPTRVCFTGASVDTELFKTPSVQLSGVPISGNFPLELVRRVGSNYLVQTLIFDKTRSEGDCNEAERHSLSLTLELDSSGQVLFLTSLLGEYSHTTDSCHSSPEVTLIPYIEVPASPF